ncbi:MAG: pilus assembly FimT family protein [Limisphaerales bacterium]
MESSPPSFLSLHGGVHPVRAKGFTLIEIMIVIAIVGIVMMTGLPSIVKWRDRDQLAIAVKDTIEGCKTARDRAILQGVPWEFVVTIAENGERQLQVREAPRQDFRSDGEGARASAKASESTYSGFPRKLGNDVLVQLIEVNFQSPGEGNEARARFFPNGTADEFTVVYELSGKQRFIKTDIITGMANEFDPP